MSKISKQRELWLWRRVYAVLRGSNIAYSGVKRRVVVERFCSVVGVPVPVKRDYLLVLDEYFRLNDVKPIRPKGYGVSGKKKRGAAWSFYESEDWLSLRKVVFSLYGRRCMCCGGSYRVMHVDHILPRSLHPDRELDLLNLQVLCCSCNRRKSNVDFTDYRTSEHLASLSAYLGG